MRGLICFLIVIFEGCYFQEYGKRNDAIYEGMIDDEDEDTTLAF